MVASKYLSVPLQGILSERLKDMIYCETFGKRQKKEKTRMNVKTYSAASCVILEFVHLEAFSCYEHLVAFVTARV
jgi:hypothetical protein